MNIQSALNWRYAVREFTTDTLSEAQLTALLEATRKSASSYGLQPYRLIVVSSRDIRSQLLTVSNGQQKVLDCSHLVVLAAEKQIDDQTVDRYVDRLVNMRKVTRESIEGYAVHMKEALGAKTEIEKKEWAHQQAYIALGTLLTAAAVMNIDSCPMTGIDREAYDKVLGLDKLGLETSSIVTLGYRSPSDSTASLPKVRLKFEDFVLRY